MRNISVCTIVVFDSSKDFSFDKVTFNKVFCNGILAQTEFSVPDSGEATGPVNQEANVTQLGASIKFEYKPFLPTIPVFDI